MNSRIRRMDNLSGLSGYMSISFWLFAQLPQVIKNHNDKSVDGFSLGFLMCWFGGDFLNLISCLLNDAFFFQILLSGYYCMIDVILASQYYYYKYMYHNPESRWYHKLQQRNTRVIQSPRESLRDNLDTYGSIYTELDIANQTKKEHPKKADQIPMGFKGGRRLQSADGNHRRVDSNGTPPVHVQGLFNKKQGISKLVTSALMTGLSKADGLPIPADVPEKENNSIIYKLAMFIVSFLCNKSSIGTILAWSCTFLYLVSRLPQIYTNYNIKSTKGVSLKLIFFALFGNLFYSLSLILCEDANIGGETTRQFWKAELSYFCGALGTVVFDFIVILQYFRYDHNVKKKLVYKRTKSGKLKLVTPKLHSTVSPHFKNVSDSATVNKHNQLTAGISIRELTKDISSPINVSASLKSTLSPNNIKKLNEFTPLSPMDFLLDDFMMSKETNSQPPTTRASVKSFKKYSSSIRNTPSSLHRYHIYDEEVDNHSEHDNALETMSIEE